MSAELLRRAAARVEELASKATPGPWRTNDVEGIFYIASASHGPVTMDNDNPVCACSFDDTEGVAIERVDDEGGRDDAEWMVTFDPQIAGLLAAWFRSQADETAMIDEMNAAASRRAKRTGGDGHTFVIQPDRTAHATYLARAILGEDT